MKGLVYILSICLSVVSCQAQDTAEAESNLEQQSEQQIYVNEYGQVELVQKNDTLWQCIFTNNDGFEFDTSLAVKNKDGFFRFRDSNAVFLPCNWGGINFTESELFVTEMSSYGLLGSKAKLWEMYERSFFRTGQEVYFQGDVYPEKDGLKANGMYFRLKENDPEPAYYNITGTIRKEKYPVAYYSTDESPQGKLGDDTTKIFYRLILENPTFELPETFIYEGSKVNTSAGKAAIAWDWADSEAYTLDGHELWTDEEIGQHFKVKGYLTQSFYGSVLKNWEIIK